MVDYKIDQNFQLVKKDYGSFQEVDGLKEFEQEIVSKLHGELFDVFQSDSGNSETKLKIRLKVKRLAKEFDVIDRVSNISVRKERSGEGTYNVRIHYESNTDFSEVF
jgi:hypothetical protein